MTAPALRPACLFAALFACTAATAADGLRIHPTPPTAFDRIDLRLGADSCSFDPASVRVEARDGTFHVRQQPRQCLLPGTPLVADIGLGALPAGHYRVAVYTSLDSAAAPAQTLDFDVLTPVEAAVVPPPPRPLTDYSGLWAVPSEGGWGLDLVQGPGFLFGALYVYDAQSAPQWFTLQDGAWTSSTVWSGKIYRSSGSSVTLPNYDPHALQYSEVGTATLDFSHTPGDEDFDTLGYTLNGLRASKRIQRLR